MSIIQTRRTPLVYLIGWSLWTSVTPRRTKKQSFEQWNNIKTFDDVSRAEAQIICGLIDPYSGHARLIQVTPLRQPEVCYGAGNCRPPVGVGCPAGEELCYVGSLRGSGEQSLAPYGPVHFNTRREYNSGLMVAKATVKGFNKTWSILIDSEASGSYIRRYSLEGNPRYVNVIEAHKADKITIRLATGTLVAAPKVSVNLDVKFLDFQ